MATMNPKDFFTNRLADMELEEQSNPTQDRFNNLIQATERRLDQLKTQADHRQAVVARNAASIVGKLGLDADSGAALAINAAASVASGVGRTAGQLLSAPSSLAAGAETSKLTNSDWAAFTALQDGTATPEQVQQLNRDTSGGDFTLGNIRRSLTGEADTPLARIQAADGMRGAARSINDTFDWSSLVQQDRRDQLSQDLGQNFQANWDKTTDGTVKGALTGVAGLLAEAGKAAVNNPGAVVEYVAENIPQLALGAFGAAGKAGLAASNVGYAADNFQKGIEKYQAENKGAYPPPEVREEMALWAAATAGAEQVGDVALLRGVAGGAADAAQAGRRGIKDVVKGTASGVATEAATEGFQTYAEGQAGLKPATPQEIYEGAVIGGLVGGAMQGGGTGIAVATDAISAATDKADTVIAERKVNNEAFDKAVANNDPSVFTKATFPTYAPDEAVRVLAKAATEENQEANYQKAAGIVSDAETRLQDVQERITVAENPDEAITTINQDIAQSEALLATAAPEDVETIQEHIELQKQTIADVQDDAKNLKTLKQREAKLNKQVSAATKLIDQFASRVKSEEVTEVTTPEQAKKVINLAMTAPDKLDTPTVKKLIADTGNALTTEQREYLRSVDAARIAENAAKDIKGVNTDILYGSEKFKGIRDYRERLNRALVDNKVPVANAVVSGFTKFANQQQSKAAAIQDAFDMSIDGNTYTVAPNKAGVWNVLPEQLSESARKQVGGLNIHANSTKLVAASKYEADAVQSALVEFKNAIAASSVAPATPSALSQQAAPSQATQEAPAAVPEVLAPKGTVGAVTTAAQPETAVQSPTDVMVQNGEVDQTQVASPSSAEETSTPTTTESPAAPTTNTVEETEREKSVFANKVSEEEAKKLGYKKLNLVAQYFKVAKKKATDATARPLVASKDFLSKLSKAEVDATEYLVEKNLTEEQVIAISDFTTKANAWLPNIQENLFVGNADFRYEDPIQFLVTDTDGVVDAAENVKTAIAYAAYSWLAENANMPRFATREQVKEMFGVDEQDKIGNDLYSVVREAGTMEKVAMNSLGQRAVAALGLQATKDAPADSQARLEASIGAHALKLLEDQGLVKRIKVPGAVVKAGLPNTLAQNTNVFAELGFISPMREDGKLVQAADEISKAQKATQSVLNKMFGVETDYKEPSLTPITTVQETTKNTDQKVPKKLQEIIRHENSVPNLVRQDTRFLTEKMSEKAVLEIAGYDSRDTTQMHKVNRESVEAKNDGLMRELKNAREYFPTLEEGQELYFEHSVWKQQRVGIATNLINPQTSKIHRFMLYRPEWETKVSLNDRAMMDNFSIRVAEGLGVKADKQSNEVSLQDFERKINDPLIVAAVEAIQKVMIQGEEMTPGFETAITRGAKAGGEDMHSLDALIALAHYKQAKDTGQDSFTTYLMGEVDGVTNGPMLSHLMMGAGTSASDLYGVLNKGGFYTQESGVQNYNLWRASEGNQDLYETTIANVMKNVQLTSKNSVPMQGALKSLYAITGDLLDANEKVVKAGRNIIKTPLTAMVFGSATNGAINSMFGKFVDTAYEKIEGLMKINDPAEADAAKVRLIVHINNLIIYGNPSVAKLNPKMSIAELLDTSFDSKQEEALKKAFDGTLGNAVKTTMETDFAVFMERRSVYNTAAQAAFQLYDAARKGITQTFMTELMDTGDLAFNTVRGERSPLHDLTGAQKEELAKRLKPIEPILETLFSQESGNQLDAGLAISKSSRKLSEAAQYKGVAKFGKPTVDGAKTRVTAAYERTLTPPGVAMLPMGAHSTDSAISHNGVMGFGKPTQVLNVHDAHGTGLKYFQRTAQNLNRATWEAMLNYSPATQMVEALNRVVTGLDEIMKDPSTAATIAPHLKPVLAALAKKQKTGTDTVLKEIIEDISAMAIDADTVKFDTLAQMGAVDQYALEGGQYVVTDADRAMAQKMKDQISKDVDTQILAAADRIATAKTTKTMPMEVDAEFNEEPSPAPAKALAATVSPIVAAVASQVIPEAAVLAQGNPVEQAVAAQTPIVQAKVVQAVTKAANTLRKAFSPWGEIGNPTAAQDQTLVEAFEANPDMNKAQVMTTLRAALQTQGGPSNVRDFNARLFTILNKLVPADIKVKYVTPSTEASEVMEKGANNARGWFVSNSNQNEIYILSTAHKNAAVTPEVLLHELTHSVLAGIVENVASQPKEVQELVADLENLRAKAQKYMADNNLEQYAPAVVNIHEFIAYGMTNLGFQKDVVSKTSMQSKTRKNELVQGMKAFIQSITAILFRGSDRSRQAITVNGMSILVSNVSGLFNAVSQAPSKADVLLNAQSVDPLDAAMELNTIQIMESIKSSNPDNQVSIAFEAQLNSVLANIVDKLHGPYGTLKELVKQDRAITPTDVYAKALNTGVLPFASKSIAAGFKINDQEAFVMDQVEATVRETIDRNESRTTIAHKELRKIYAQAKSQLKPMDFLPDGVTQATASVGDIAAANNLYNYVFSAQANADGTSDYLSRFAAMALGHEQFASKLGFATDTAEREGNTLYDKVLRIFDKLASYIGDLLTGTRDGQLADEKIATLVEKLVDIEAKKQAQIAQAKGSLTDSLESITRGMSDTARDQLVKFGKSKVFQNSKSGYIRFAGTAFQLIGAPERVTAVAEKGMEMRDKMLRERQGVIASLVTEMQGITDDKAVFGKLLLATKNLERARKEAITNTGNFIKQSFAKKEFTKEENKALTNTFLRTDMASLVDSYSMDDMQKLVSDGAYRQAEIAKLEAVIAKDTNAQFYMNSIKGLGYYLATGLVKIPHLQMNAHNIARAGSTSAMTKITEEHAASIEPTIDQLVSLYAIDYLGQEERQLAANVLRGELNRKDGGNGIEMIVKLHKQLQQQSKDTLFQGNDALFMKGYTSEIYNPYLDVMVADDAEGRELMLAGYSEGIPVKNDPLDRNPAKKMYVIRDGGLQSHLTGIISYTGKKARGSTVTNDDPAFLQDKQVEIQSMFTRSFDPKAVSQNYMAPVINNQGYVADYRYMMNHNTKDDVLERDNRFDKVLGAYAGSIIDKQSTPMQNAKAVQALYDQYMLEADTQADRYLEISPRSKDPALREHWALLPKETKQAVKDIWGQDKMYVRADMIDLNFGYRKYTLANIFAKDKDERGQMEQIFAFGVEAIMRGVGASKGLRGAALEDFLKRSGLYVRRAEDMWQEVVKEAKDIIVVRSGVVLLGNISSNLTELAWMGVPMKDIVRHHKVALKAASDYQADSARLQQVQTMLNTGYLEGNVNDLEQEVVLLTDALNRNPVKELIDAGLMPTIVEDLATDDDIYSYKSRFARKTEGLTNKLNDKVKTAAKYAYVSHDTALYKGLNRATQLSDFVARYTLYHHVTERANNPLSKEDAVRYASDAFVNYDIPSHRSLQYLNDMGVVMFTKYYIRIQKVLMRLFRENPARGMMMLAFNQFFDAIPTITDSALWNKFGNLPFTTGAFKYPSVLDDLAPVKLAMSPFK